MSQKGVYICECPRSGGKPKHLRGCQFFRPATCHPDRPRLTKGLCSSCYQIHLAHRSPQTRATRRKHARRSRLLKRYGISEDTYNRLLHKQKHVCAICHETCASGRKLAVDHDHKTGQVRGLLCRMCNQTIGRLKDDLTLLQRAVEYLKEPCMVTLGDFRHYSGTLYTVLVICKDSETLQRMIVYTKYPPEPSTSAGDTPYLMCSEKNFEEEVEWPDGVRRPRFVREVSNGDVRSS